MRTQPVVAAALLLAAPALAKTPDGLTPSVENLCDQFEGSAYGLCTSYCEAMDCDHDAVRAADQACTSVASQFKSKTGHDLFCTIEVPCEIVAEDDLFNFPKGAEINFTISVLDNDVASAGSTATMRDSTAAGAENVTVIDDGAGRYQATGETFFTYNACCSADVCDSANVSVAIGS